MECLPWRVWGKEPPAELRDIKNFLIKFGDADEIAAKAEALSELRAKQDAELSTNVWLAAVGLDKEGNVVKKVQRDLPPGVTHYVPDGGHAPSSAGTPDTATPTGRPKRRKGVEVSLREKGSGGSST